MSEPKPIPVNVSRARTRILYRSDLNRHILGGGVWYLVTSYNTIHPFVVCAGQPYLIVEEVHRVVVELEGQRLQEGYVVGHDLLIGEVKLVDNDGVHMVVGQQVIWVDGRMGGDSTMWKILRSSYTHLPK